MQLLRDNLTLWTSDMQTEGAKDGEEDKEGRSREHKHFFLLIAPILWYLELNPFDAW